MNGDKLTRWATVLAVVAVAAVAAIISFQHAVGVVTSHGEPGAVGKCYPVAIDGIIIAASMVLLDAARHAEDAPVLAWGLLAAGILVTLAANLAYGVRSGVPGALWAAWPAIAFVGCYELLMLLVRASARRARAGVPIPPTGPALAPIPDEVPGTVSSPVPTSAENAALTALRATLAAGNPYSNNQLAERFGLTRAQVTKVRQLASAEMNGHAPDDN